MDDYILISWLNDFIFCPISIYFHQLYGNKEKKFSEEDNIMIMKLSKYCDITRFGYAKHDTDEIIIV